MADEPIVMASTTTLTSHGGPRAAMPVSMPLPFGEEQGNADGVDKAAKDQPSKSTASSSKNNDETEKQAQELQEKLASLGKLKGWAIHFSLEPEFDRPVIKVIDAESGQVIRQIPSEEILKMNKRLQEMGQNHGDVPGLSGLLLDGQV